MPFTLHTPCLRTTIWGSCGCNSLSSCLTASRFALCSADSWIAAIPPVLPTFLPNTTRESPAFATKSVCWNITPTRQQVPALTIWGRAFHEPDTRAVYPSSVWRNALSIVSGVTTPRDSADIAAQTRNLRELASEAFLYQQKKTTWNQPTPNAHTPWRNQDWS